MGKRLCGAIAAGIAMVCCGAMTGTAGAQTTSTHLVPGVLPGLSQATLVAPAATGRTLEIGVGIQRPDTAGETSLLDAIDDPSSPEYRHYLTVGQFDAEFGVAPSTTAAVRSWLTDGGLTIDTSSAGGDYFTATGTVAQLDALFDVSIGQYTYKGGSFLANDVAPSVPSDLPIDAVAGLETLSHYTVDSLDGRKLAQATTARAARAAGRAIVRTDAQQPAQAGPQAGDEQTYTPQDLWGIYNDPGASALTGPDGLSDPTALENSSATLGQGQTVGVFGEGETSSIIRQLRLFEGTLGLPKVPVRTIETEGTPDDAYGDNSGAVEWYLDSQASTGMAPDVSGLDFYFSKGFQDADITQSFDYWANDPNGPREMNASFGECEQNPTEPITGPLSTLPAGVGLGGDAEVLADPALRQAAIEGRTLFTSAGDTGSGCPSIYAPVLGGGNGLAIQPVPFQNYPCVSDYVVCVGGTVVSSPGTAYPQSAQRTAETSWTYTGGGTSYFNPAPSYQDGITAIDQDCVSDPTGTTVYNPVTNPAPLCRGVPDVADLSGNSLDDAYFIYIDGEPSEEGGTSLSSPLMMGQWARIQAAAPAPVQSAGGLGFANATIYRQAQDADTCTTGTCTGTSYARDFYDVTDSEFGAGNGVYQPHAGWDYTSGWGAINVGNFAQDVDGSTDATDAYSGEEQPAADVCTATMTSPAGNAVDPITDSTADSGLDLTQATLSASSPQTITATLTVPDLSAGPPAESTSGAAFYVAWEYGGLVYYGVAHESEAGAGWTFSSGTTGPAIANGAPVLGSYSDTASSQATGSADTSTGVITINIPASEVGSPPAGTVLADPQAFVQIDVGAPEVITALAITEDSADNLGSVSADGGATDSVGADVVVNGVAGVNCNNLPTPTSGPSGSGTPAGGSSAGAAPSGAGAAPSGTGSSPRPRASATTCAGSGRASTHVRQRRVFGRRLKLTGIAKAHCPAHIVKVSVAIARVVGHRCRFLLADHRFGRLRSCVARDYLKAKGTRHWSLRVKRKLPRGRYFAWERAVDNQHHVIRNQSRKHIRFRVT
jgi:hypothetical protein